VKRVDDLRSDGTHGSVAVLRNVLQHVEGADRVDLEMVHQNAFGLADDIPVGQRGLEYLGAPCPTGWWASR
jgi:hypothetical protein